MYYYITFLPFIHSIIIYKIMYSFLLASYSQVFIIIIYMQCFIPIQIHLPFILLITIVFVQMLE